jgi:Fe(II)/alpha-ketoglutarate-dependent arginine beta-hydroxylase
MRVSETAAAWIVSGLPVDDAAIGPTPEGSARQPDPASTVREEMWLVVCATLMGDVFGWATQQDGALIHDISPVRGHEHSQLGSGSSGLLWWHTEEAFHPFKCDYLTLLCLRNPDRVPTTVASVGDIELDEEVQRVLFEPRFIVRPDDSHLNEPRGWPAPNDKESQLLGAARARIKQMNSRPATMPVLSGDPDSPYLSIDPFYMEVTGHDPRARAALEAISAAIDARLRGVALAPGDMLFIDNLRAVHGRRPFKARFDGTDRWLKRVNVTRDLRKSRAVRMTCESRIIY